MILDRIHGFIVGLALRRIVTKTIVVSLRLDFLFRLDNRTFFTGEVSFTVKDFEDFQITNDMKLRGFLVVAVNGGHNSVISIGFQKSNGGESAANCGLRNRLFNIPTGIPLRQCETSLRHMGLES